jgi:hypothetical protein
VTDTLNATELRLWAAHCLAQANDGMCSGEERDRLMTMHDSLLALAENSDWLEGRPSRAGADRATYVSASA